MFTLRTESENTSQPYTLASLSAPNLLKVMSDSTGDLSMKERRREARREDMEKRKKLFYVNGSSIGCTFLIGKCQCLSVVLYSNA